MESIPISGYLKLRSRGICHKIYNFMMEGGESIKPLLGIQSKSLRGDGFSGYGNGLVNTEQGCGI
jgi:hypothetical protein